MAPVLLGMAMLEALFLQACQGLGPCEVIRARCAVRERLQEPASKLTLFNSSVPCLLVLPRHLPKLGVHLNALAALPLCLSECVQADMLHTDPSAGLKSKELQPWNPGSLLNTQRSTCTTRRGGSSRPLLAARVFARTHLAPPFVHPTSQGRPPSLAASASLTTGTCMIHRRDPSRARAPHRTRSHGWARVQSAQMAVALRQKLVLNTSQDITRCCYLQPVAGYMPAAPHIPSRHKQPSGRCFPASRPRCPDG